MDDEDVDPVIETVAIAIRDAVCNRLGVGGRPGQGRPWANLPAQLRVSYREEAVAAITAYKMAEAFHG
jgi:hypothetical protein